MAAEHLGGLQERALAGVEVLVEHGARGDQRRVGEAQRGGGELGVGGGAGVVDLLGHGQLVLGAVAVGRDDDAADALAALVADEVAGEGGDALELHVGAVGDELLPVLATGVVDRGGDELEVHRVVGVGEDHEAVLVRGRRVGGVVLHALLAGLDHPRRARWGRRPG